MKNMTYRLVTDENGEIGISIENIESWSKHYASILESMKTDSIQFDGKFEVMSLLYRVSKDMAADPEKFLIKKKPGRPKNNTKIKVRRTMCMFYQLNRASTLMEAKELTAKHLGKSFDAVDKAARGFTLEQMEAGKYYF